jgi:ABC-type amino acid transport substrate-binding protein
MGGFLVRDRKRVVRAGVVMVAALGVVVAGVWLLLHTTVDTTYRKDEVIRRMQSPRREYPATVHTSLESVPRDAPPGEGSTLDRIRARGTLRVGYDPDNLPMSFFNRDGQLVGLDVELSQALAETLGVQAEFVPIDWTRLPALLADGTIDVMPGMWYRPNWFPSLRLSNPYLQGTMALAVRDERRREFARVEDLRRSEGLTIGISLDRRQVETSLRRYFDGSEIEIVVLDFWRPFFEGEHPEIDAFLVPAENASAWTLLHPEYTVVTPQPDPVRVPSGFGVALDADDLLTAVNEWVVFATSEGKIDRARNYWVLGQGAEATGPRWSIIRNVLGWVE